MSWFREWLAGDGVGRTPAAPPRPDAQPDAPPTRSTSTGPPPARARPDAAASSYPGERLGLPEHGVDAVATLPLRAGQFLLDLVLAGVVAAIIAFPAPSWLSLSVWALMVGVPVAVVGRTPAMALLGLRAVRVDAPVAVGLGWALVRTVALFFVVPGMVVDRDSRGVQDRLSRTVVLRTR